MTCEFCGGEVLVLGKYCPSCGKIRNSRIELNFKQEDKAKFAFQSEYYTVSFMKGISSPIFPEVGYAYSKTKNALYQIQKIDDTRKCVHIITNGNISDSSIIKDEDFNHNYVVANNQGIYSYNYYSSQQNILLYDDQGKKLGSVSIQGKNGDKPKAMYIFDSKIYAAYINDNQERKFNNSKLVVEEFNILNGKRRTIWKSDNINSELTKTIKGYMETCKLPLFKENIRPVMINEKEWNGGFYSTNLFANSEKIVLLFSFNAEVEGYEYGRDIALLIDIETSEFEVIDNGALPNREIAYMDMQNGTLWYREKGIQNKKNVYKTTVRNYWYDNISCDSDEMWNLSCDNKTFDKGSYFDGRHAYYADGMYKFYALDKEGNYSEWNDSRDGSTKMYMFGPYVYANLDTGSDRIFESSIEKVSCFHVDKEMLNQSLENAERKGEN